MLMENKEMKNMAMTAEQNYEVNCEMSQSDIRQTVLHAVSQISQGKARNFDEVCDQLIKKYTDA